MVVPLIVLGRDCCSRDCFCRGSSTPAAAPGLITQVGVIKMESTAAVKRQSKQVCVAMPPAENSIPRAEKTDMKERILQTADRLFYLKGIRAIGVDTIAAEIGISKRTLYNHFPSKDSLIKAYLDRRFVVNGAHEAVVGMALTFADRGTHGLRKEYQAIGGSSPSTGAQHGIACAPYLPIRAQPRRTERPHRTPTPNAPP